jgi:ubiquinone biosynthesis protein
MPNILSHSSKSKFGRYEEVMTTLFKYGFEDLASNPPLNKFLPQKGKLVPRRRGKKVNEFSRFERIRMVCEELGTTFIKFAQIASNRPDLLPEELIQELEKLQDQAPAVPIEIIKSTLADELYRPMDELVEDFDERYIASASMAQVHRARLMGGKEVVLKIQRPNLKEQINADLEILENLVSLIENQFPKYLVYNPRELLKMFKNSISEEISFRNEVNNMKYFTKMFEGNQDIYIPMLYEELCTDRVICMEYIDGHKITDIENLNKHNISGAQIATKGMNLYFEQVFEHGFFHADPHPGNLFVREDGKIVFIDYGMMGSIRDADIILLASLLISVYQKDVQGLKKSLMNFTRALDKEKQIDMEYEIMFMFRNYSTLSIENIDGEAVMKGLNDLFYNYKIKIPSNLLLLLKALAIIEGVGLRLDPEYDIIQNIEPYAKRLLAKKLDPKKMTKNIIQTLDEGSRLLMDFPHDMKEIINRVKEGKIHFEFEHKGLEPLYKNMDVFVNRIAYSLLVVALLVSSSIIVVADFPPKIYNIPVLGFAGFILSTLLALYLIFAIIKHGKI